MDPRIVQSFKKKFAFWVAIWIDDKMFHAFISFCINSHLILIHMWLKEYTLQKIIQFGLDEV